MKSALLASLSALTLAACAAGPDYVAPIAPPKAAAPFVSTGAATVTAAPDDSWWRLYRDPVLMSIGEGTNDVLRTVIAKSLVAGTTVVG